MDLSFQGLLALARETLQNPRGVARIVMNANLPMPARWVALGLMVVGSALLAHLSFLVMPADAQAVLAEGMSSPFTTAVLQGVVMVMAVAAIFFLGRVMGGVGSFSDALILVVWVQFILLILQAAQIVAQVLIPPAAIVVSYASIGIFLYLLSHFVAELHGFPSVLKTFGGILLALLAIGFALALILMPMMGTGF